MVPSFVLGLLAALPLLALGSPVPAAAPPVSRVDDSLVPDTFIVVLNSDISASEFNAHKTFVSELHEKSIGKRDTGLEGLKASWEIHTDFKGYVGQFDQATVEEIATRTEVKYIEPDRVVHSQAMVTQVNVEGQWGLSSISHSASTGSSYVYDSSAGTGVTAYMIDTGILTTHQEFSGRATWGTNFVNNVNSDENGHGTHVSGILAGSTFGVAKSAHLVAVKVLDADGLGSMSTVVSGIQWAVNDAQANGRGTRSVINISISGFYNQAINDAVQAAVNIGMTVAVAAGNNENQAGGYSPASAPNAITAGAITSANARAGYSNFGSVLDIWAPGDNIVSAYIGSNSATAVLSGTSMASPQIAGLAAYLIALDSLATPASVRAKMVSMAVGGVTGGFTGSPSIRAYNGNGA